MYCFYYDKNGAKQQIANPAYLNQLALFGVITSDTVLEDENGGLVPAKDVEGLEFKAGTKYLGYNEFKTETKSEYSERWSTIFALPFIGLAILLLVLCFRTGSKTLAQIGLVFIVMAAIVYYSSKIFLFLSHRK